MDDIREIMSTMQRQAEVDAAMLESMAIALRAGLDFSFNRNEMADLLDRIRKEHFEHLL